MNELNEKFEEVERLIWCEWFSLAIILFLILILISGCGLSGTRYAWNPEPVKEVTCNDIPYVLWVTDISLFKTTGYLRTNGCMQWVSQEYPKLKKEGKNPFIIFGIYREVRDASQVAYQSYYGDMVWYKKLDKENFGDKIKGHALLGYFENGKLLVSDGDINNEGLCAGYGGYWDCHVITNFKPIVMFNERENYLFKGGVE